MYIYGLGSMVTTFVTVGTRSALTKIVGKEDVGKCFAVIGCVAALTSFITPLYQVVYINSFDYHLGLAYCIVATLVVINIFNSGYAYFHVRSVKKKAGGIFFETATGGKSKEEMELEKLPKDSHSVERL